MGKWYAGVVHSHTNRSDGKYTPAELIKKAEKKGLDFLIITDHNRFADDVPYSDKMLVIPGAELTIDGSGHTNIWGLSHPIDNFDCPDYDEWQRKVSMAKERGATVCINHPWCSQCGWHWPLEPEKADCIELWNSPQHTDNMVCAEWWQNELRKGKKIPVVGGSDFHRNYLVTDFLDNPVSFVYAEECTQDTILQAIREGHVTIAPHICGQMIELQSGDNIIGDTVKLTDNTSVIVRVNNLKKGQTLKVIGNEGVLLQYTAVSSGPYCAEIPVVKPGFVCAQVEYTLNSLVAAAYAQVEKKILHSKNKGELPPFIYSQTGAIYFE